MESPRTILASAGLFASAGDFVDTRFTDEEFTAAQQSGDLGPFNLNRVPLAVVDGVVIGQSKPICRVLARMFGMMGSSDIDAAQIEAICEHIYELGDAYRKLFPYGKQFPAEEEAKLNATWFDTPASPAQEGRAERQLEWYLAAIERTVGSDGYAFGGQPSLADAVIYNALGEVCADLGKKGEPFNDKARLDAKLASNPNLQAILTTFGSSENMVKYLGERGVQEF